MQMTEGKRKPDKAMRRVHETKLFFVLVFGQLHVVIHVLHVVEIFEFIQRIKDSGVTVIIVEQNAVATLEMSDYAYVMQNGETVLEGTGQALLADEQVKKAYLGG